MQDIDFDLAGAKKAGAKPAQLSSYFKSNFNIDFDFDGAYKAGASDNQILSYLNQSYSDLKKKENSGVDSGVKSSPTPSKYTLKEEAPKKQYYSSKLDKGLIFDKEGQLYAPSSEALTKAIAPPAEDLNLKKSTQKDLVEQSRIPKEKPIKPVEEQGLLLNLVSGLDRGFYKNFIGSPVKGLGTILQGATKKVMGGTGEGFVSDNLIKLGDYFNNAIDELTFQDEEFKNTLLDQAAQALGQAGALILTGGLTGAGEAGTAALVSQAPKGAAATALKTLGSQLSSPTAVSAGLSMGQAEFDRAIQAGATDDQAFEAFYKNAVTGSVLETVPVMQFFKRFNKSTAGSVANYIKTKGVAGLTGGIEEMTTEVMQQIYANKTAKDIYNINQDILDGVGSSGGIGFGIGFLLNAMGANAKILRKQGKVQEADVLENQVKQYEDNLENPKVTSGNKVSAKDIVTQGPDIGTQKAVQNLDRDLANNVITPEQYQQGVVFAEKAAQVADKIPETVTGESRVKSVELLVERNDIKQANDNLIQQKQTTDEAYHAGIDEEIKANEEKIKKVDAEVYNIAKKPSKEFGTKKYEVDGEEVTKEAFEALQGKPIGTKTVIKAEVKPTEVVVSKSESTNPSFEDMIDLNIEGGKIEIGKVKGAKVYSIIELKVNEDKRKQGIATKLLQRALDETNGDLSGMASNDMSVGLNYKLGMRAFDSNGKELSLEETKKARAEKAGGSIKMVLPENERGNNYKSKSTQEKVKPTEVKAIEKENEPIDFRKELTSQIDKKEIELINKQQSDIDKAKADLKEIQNNNQEVISEYVKKSGYKLITKNTINPASKTGEKFPETDIGKYYKFTGSSLIRNSAKNLALKGAEAKAKSTPQGSKGGMNKYYNAFGAVKDYENGDITKNQLLKTIKDSGLDIEKFDIKKQEEPKKTYQEALKEKQVAEKKLTRQIAGEKAGVTRNIIKEASKIEPSDARSAALKRLAGGSLSWEAIDEVAGRVKGARLNTGEREFKSEEARSRDYVAKKGEGESLDAVAGNIWDNLSEEMQGKMDTQDVKNALIAVVSEYNSKAEIAQALIDGYKEESIEELENRYYERFGDNAEIEIDKELNQVPKNQLDIEQELINANYESEQQFQDDYWNTKEATNDFTEKAPSTKAQKAETAKGLAEAYKDLTINQKRQIINSKFDELLKELKIEKICPT